jgi:Domain found in Dishevelled, Egl-10, and Pleckstrin (DEP)
VAALYFVDEPMSVQQVPLSIYSDLPAGISQSTVAAITNALGFSLLTIDKHLTTPASEFVAKLQALAQSHPEVSFIFDLGRLASLGMSVTQLGAQIESVNLKNRIFLCNSEGQMSIGTRALVRALGFAEVAADIDPRDSLGGLKSLSDWLCQQAPRAQERVNRLPAFLKTVSLSSVNEPPRALVQRLSGRCAELLTNDLIRHIEVRDRTYHLKGYPACFLSNEACQYLQQKYRLVETQAVAVGKALQALGLTYHVAHEQEFSNQGLFFRFACSAVADKLSALEVWHAFTKQVEIKDRTYLGRDYPKSFVGSEAVSQIAKQWSVDRLDAWIMLHRFELLGLLEHVTQDHGMVDGNFYYRLN